ncbi:MAG: IMP dehydrogenase, partial [Mesotoga sp.]|nr:IMP dehydrogenase [Mesotoga sp.]
MGMFDRAYTFDDVLLVPGYSEILPREVDLRSRITRNLWLKVPFISAAMDTVTEAEMARAMALMGGMGVIHKNLSIEGQAEHVERVKNTSVDRERYPLCSLDSSGRLMVGAAVGTGPGTAERIEAVVRAGIDVLAIDTAHGHSKRVIDSLSLARELYPSLQIIAGNVVTSSGTLALIEAGADAVKVGIGPGSICTTRIVAGVGYPQLSAVMECSQAARERDVPVISDGGIRYSGDIVKALAAGASSVMMGNIFAGTRECPGKS